MDNHLTLAVAGSGKTQGIAERCAKLPNNKKVIVVTFTQQNQHELGERLSLIAGHRPDIKVIGWFSFLLNNFARPFVPFKFSKMRVKGFNFDGRPHRMAKDANRFFDKNDEVYACELSRLSFELIDQSNGSLIHRLECVYDEIIIDEVQDLSSHDWEIIESLMDSSIGIRMVGDIRQAVISTNHRSQKNKQYRYSESIHWFREKESKSSLKIVENNNTWRCCQKIADFSDTIFGTDGTFPKTISRNNEITWHDGVFLVREKHVFQYIMSFKSPPQCLRHSVSSGKHLDLEFMNFKVSKGQTFKRVLIYPTAGIVHFLNGKSPLSPIPAASFYVAVTRARQSVAIIVKNSSSFDLPYWGPRDDS